MKTKFTITDIYSPPKMKKKKLTMKKLLQLQKKKKGKAKIVHLEEKKRGFTLAELSPQPVMQKKIKYNMSPPKNARMSPPKNARMSPPKNASLSHQMQPRLTNTKFTIQDLPSPPKQVKRTNRKITIDDIPSPKQSSSSSSHNKHEPISPTPCCACKRVMKEGDKTPDDCVWCEFKFHLHKCTKKNATERNREKREKRATRVTQVTQKQMKTFVQNMKRITI
jgi:hypothetical protein